ncbi:uncharacterized protein LOC132743988 [Ruditapes philippinarum]|uniref:uncharacterized protein LOC132743988 n=1 Tax=Ruditapes philippinarum TaxID=129788 RepID=UPI00295A681D|nr:uncharacterized protein LOC132743988 [Ruditapes philippinarum]
MRLSQYAEWKKKLKDQLITWYNANQSTVPLSPLTDDSHTPLAGFYILPEIDIQTNLSGGKKVTTRVKSLLDLFASDRKRQLKIYLSAIAGFGKTAFSKYLTITWCQAHKKDESYKHFKEKELDALSDFKFLFLVLLRDSVNVCDVDDMIEQQVIQYLPCSSSMPKGLLKDILDHEKCLVILDGLDEWSHPENKCTKLPKSIPHQYEREKCVILTTTRPWKLGVSNLKTNQIHKTIELVQLKKDDVRQFSHNAMGILKDDTEEDELCAFEEKIRNHGLEDMKSTPLLLLYLICLWVYKFPIGNSAVEIYTGIIELLLSRTATLHGKFHSSCEISPSYIPECFENHTRCSCYSTFLLKIGKLAFYTLFSKIKEHTLVFDKNIAEKYLNQEDLKSSCLAGMLSESKTKTLIAESFKISFSHKTVQEYFSAIFISFISFQDTNEVQKIIFEECNCLQNILNMSKVFVFISNMNPKLMSAISRDLMPMINNDEKTGKYRTNTDINHMPVLQDIQDMYISCAIETKENINLKLYLQDFRISDNAQCQELQHLCQQNKENIKSIMIRNVDIYSLQEIIKLFALSDFPLIEKFYYKGEIKEEEEDEITSLLFNTLKCFTMRSCKYKNHAFHAKYCRLSAEINDRLENLQHLEYLCLTYFTMTHEIMERLLIFLTSKKSMKEIILYELKCSDHDTDDISCRFNLDLSQHLHLRYLGLTRIPVSKINMDASLLEQCTVGELHQPGDASSFLSRLPAASKLHTLMCQHIKSSCDIETMLKTLPLLHYMKEVWLYGINLGEKSLKLSPKMTNIELVALYYITMSCTVLNDLISVDLITVINKLPHTVTVCLEGCDIKPETEFENFKTLIKNSDIFVITHDGTLKSGTYRFEFKTIETT